MNFSERLKSLRLESGYTQKELAKLLDIGQSSYANYENGKNKPRLARLEEIAVLFNVSVSYLLGETNVRTPSKLKNDLDFSKRIKELRLEAGYTQKELAKKLDMTGAGYSKYGTGSETTFPRTERLQRLAEVFNVSVSYLLGETDERPIVKENKSVTLQERLKHLRTQAGYSQVELAKILNLSSRQTYNNYETGANKPSKESLDKLAEVLGVSVEYLLCETDEPES